MEFELGEVLFGGGVVERGFELAFEKAGVVKEFFTFSGFDAFAEVDDLFGSFGFLGFAKFVFDFCVGSCALISFRLFNFQRLLNFWLHNQISNFQLTTFHKIIINLFLHILRNILNKTMLPRNHSRRQRLCIRFLRWLNPSQHRSMPM